MRGKTHLALGITIGITIGVLQYGSKAPAFCIGCMIGSLFPDIDHPESTIGRKIPLIPKVINKIGGHRGLVHSPMFLAVMFAGLSIIGIHWEYYVEATGFITGFLIHLIQDSYTKGGIKWLYPLKKAFSFSSHRSGSRWDIIHSVFIYFIIVLPVLFLACA